MKTILVPTDFTENSRSSSEFALQFAKIHHSKLILFHAFHIPASVNEAQVLVITVDELEKTNYERLCQLRDELKLKAGDEIDIECVVRAAFAVDEILNLTEEKHVDLVIMGISAGNKLTELMIGSNATETIKKSKVPVMVVPKQAVFKGFNKIILASDMKEISRPILEPLFDIVKLFNSELFIVNVLPPGELSTPEEAVAGLKLDHILEGINHSFHFPQSENVADGINSFADAHNAGLIVMIPHKHTFWQRLTHESTSKKMAFHTHIPLLTLPEHVKEPAHS